MDAGAAGEGAARTGARLGSLGNARLGVGALGVGALAVVGGADRAESPTKSWADGAVGASIDGKTFSSAGLGGGVCGMTAACCWFGPGGAGSGSRGAMVRVAISGATVSGEDGASSTGAWLAGGGGSGRCKAIWVGLRAGCSASLAWVRGAASAACAAVMLTVISTAGRGAWIWRCGRVERKADAISTCISADVANATGEMRRGVDLEMI